MDSSQECGKPPGVKFGILRGLKSRSPYQSTPKCVPGSIEMGWAVIHDKQEGNALLKVLMVLYRVLVNKVTSYKLQRIAPTLI